MLVGLISDTHGLMRVEALRALEGVDVILHAGDVGHRRVLDALASVAPVHAVAGNVDPPDRSLRSSVDRVFEGVRLHMSHGHEIGRPTPELMATRYEADIIVFGHTHRPVVRQIGSALVINPGAAGPARFNFKPTVAHLRLPEREARIIFL